MNAPNISFDAESRSGRLPSAAVNGSRTVAYGDWGYNAAPDFGSERESGPDFRKLLFWGIGLALKYRWLILACCALALAIEFVLTLRTTPIYQATATIQIDPEAPKLVKIDVPEGREVVDSGRFYETQYDLLRSRALAERVAKDLVLAAESDFINPPSTSAWGKLRSLIFKSSNSVPADQGNFEQRKQIATGMVQSGLSVGPVPRTSLVRISFDSPSAKW